MKSTLIASLCLSLLSQDYSQSETGLSMTRTASAIGAANTVPPTSASLTDLFSKAAFESRIPLPLLRAVCWVESNHRPKPRLKLDGLTPSYGICQVKLATARYVGFTGSVQELRKPEVNISVAAKYLALKLAKYGDWRKAVTAYNRGSFRKGMTVHNSYVIKVTFALAEGR